MYYAVNCFTILYMNKLKDINIIEIIINIIDLIEIIIEIDIISLY